VAVSPLAVAAVLVGVLSLLSFFGPMFLIVPAAGVVVAILALRQIADSGGTQTGRPLAWAGLALCVGLGGAELVALLTGTLSVRNDERGISAALVELGGVLREQKYKDAYALFDDEFQNRVDAKRFTSTWTAVQSKDGLGRLESLKWNGVRPQFLTLGGSRAAYVKALVKFERSAEERFDIVLRQVGDRWLVAQLPAFFPDKAKRAEEDVFQIPE
jgi:hypothetical protein